METVIIKKKIENIVDKAFVRENEPMSEHTSFKAGGRADLFAEPQNTDQLRDLMQLLNEESIQYMVLGNGSNVLVRDGGYRGVIVRLGEAFNYIKREGNSLICGSGTLMSAAARFAASEGLSGLEFASGIPGSIGGAVFMNAGAYDGEISHVIESADVINEDGKVVTLTKDELDFGYRSSLVMKKGYVVLSATFALKKGTVKTIKELIDDLTNKRESKQPLEYPSAGSTFKRPTGYFAGKLIQDAGLKGYSIGGAAVSEKHSGFVINKGNATAKDITDLIKYIQDEVKRQFGVDLHPEVRIIGEE